eukprot:481390_1
MSQIMFPMYNTLKLIHWIQCKIFIYEIHQSINNIQNAIFINEQNESSNYQNCASDTFASGNNFEMDVDCKMLSKIEFRKLRSELDQHLFISLIIHNNNYIHIKPSNQMLFLVLKSMYEQINMVYNYNIGYVPTLLHICLIKKFI